MKFRKLEQSLTDKKTDRFCEAMRWLRGGGGGKGLVRVSFFGRGSGQCIKSKMRDSII